MRGGYRTGSGRKKGVSALEAEKAREFIAQRVINELGPIVDKAIEQAKEGNQKAREWLLDRAYGKALQVMDISPEDQPIQIKLVQYGQLETKEIV